MCHNICGLFSLYLSVLSLKRPGRELLALRWPLRLGLAKGCPPRPAAISLGDKTSREAAPAYSLVLCLWLFPAVKLGVTRPGLDCLHLLCNFSKTGTSSNTTGFGTAHIAIPALLTGPCIFPEIIHLFLAPMYKSQKHPVSTNFKIKKKSWLPWCWDRMAHPAVTWLRWQSCSKPPGFHGALHMSLLMNMFLWYPTVFDMFLHVTWIFILLCILWVLYNREGSSKAWEKSESLICSNMRRKRLLTLFNLSHFKVIGMKLMCFCCYTVNTLNLLFSSSFPFLQTPASVTLGSSPLTQTSSHSTKEASMGQNLLPAQPPLEHSSDTVHVACSL